MRILTLVSKAVLGGHVISCFTISKYLHRKGHTVIFAGGQGAMTELIENELPFVNVEIPFFHGGEDCDNGGREAYFTWKSFSVIPKIRQILREYNIDIIHAFDARAYVHASIAALLEKKPITCTLCGGIDPLYNIPGTQKIIVFSEEQRLKMLKRYGWPSARVEVIRTRLDIEKLLTDNTPSSLDLSLDPEIPALMMISSFDGTKEKSIAQVVNSLELLLVQNKVAFQMVFIGGKGAFWKEMKEYCEEINRRLNQKIFMFTGPVIDAYKLLKDASIVLGVGRSAFEGMAYGKPTIIVGSNGFAGVVSEETVDQIAYYNFSGRNRKELSTPQELSNAIFNLLSQSVLRENLGQFSKKFVCEEIDVKNGLARIEAVYKENIKQTSASSRFLKWVSVAKIMIPIWRDNWWHTIGIPLKRLLGIKINIPKGDLKAS